MSNIGIAGFEIYHKKDDREFQVPTRKDLAKYFEEMFYHKPTQEQLDIFIRFLTGQESDANKVLDICCKQESEESEKQKI